MKIGIVTGASSGMGREFVKQLSRRKDVEEFWVIARRADRLEQLKEFTDAKLRVLPLDLTHPDSYDAVDELLKKEQPEIRYLVNAAGFGKIGKCTQIPRQDNDAMIDLNCKAAVALTTMALPYLKDGSQVIEMCSTSAFQPIPELAVYAATKAFLLSYTKALHYELMSTGIHVTAVCPYWVKDTEFIPVAKTTNQNAIRHFPFASTAPTVVRWALADSRMNLWVSTPSPVAMGHRFLAKFIPHFIMVPAWDLARRL